MPSLLNKKNEIQKNKLDNITILRFTRACKEGGGIEQYLQEINKNLLENTKITIIQLFAVTEKNKMGIEVEKIGKGEIIWIPLQEKEINRSNEIKNIYFKKNLLIKNFIRNYFLYNPLIILIFNKLIIKRERSNYRYNYNNFKKIIENVFNNYRIDLVVFHWIGGKDCEMVVQESKKQNIPYVVINHFINTKFRMLSIKEQIKNAACVGGVSGTHVPLYLKKNFFNLSDSIDIDFFSSDKFKFKNENDIVPIILLPARILYGKGHKDLLIAQDMLMKQNIIIKTVFIGRVDSQKFLAEINKFILDRNLKENVLYLGHLNQTELREWYAKSMIVVLPSYVEGLPKVLIEAQAMKVPVIAYNVGGIPQALINNKTGYLVKKGNIKGLAKKLKKLVLDKALRLKIGESGRQFVIKHYNPKALLQRHERFYLKALNQ